MLVKKLDNSQKDKEVKMQIELNHTLIDVEDINDSLDSNDMNKVIRGRSKSTLSEVVAEIVREAYSSKSGEVKLTIL